VNVFPPLSQLQYIYLSLSRPVSSPNSLDPRSHVVIIILPHLMNAFDQILINADPRAITAPITLQNRRFFMQFTEMIASDDATEPGLNVGDFRCFYLRTRVTDAAKILSTNLDLPSGYEVRKSRWFGQIVSNFDCVLQFDGIDRESQQRRHS